MPWEDIAEVLTRLGSDLLSGLFDDIIANAEQNPEQELELTADQLQAIDEAAEQADIDLTEVAVEEFPEDVSSATEAGITSSAAIISFFLRKQIVEGIAAIHSSTVATQIDNDERSAAQQASLDRALNNISNASTAESSSSFAIKHRDIAIDSDFSYYRYLTSDDDVVRPEHRERDDKIFIYGEERTVDDVPGLANNCRCVAEPLTLEEVLQGEFFYSDQRPTETQAKIMKREDVLKVKALNDIVTIDVVGAIDEWDLNSYQYFSDKVSSYLENDKQELVVNVTSYGGNADDGLLAYKLLKSVPNKVTANIYGYAGSAATYFVMGADVATIGENDSFFIHQAWSCPCGNKEDLQNAIDTLAAYDERQVEIYTDKTGLSEDEIKKLLVEEAMIDAQRALELGFIDEVRADSRRSKVARGEVSARANMGAVSALQQTSNEGETMKIEDILAFIKEKATDSDKGELLGALDGVAKKDSANAVAEVQAKLDEANVQISAKESVIQASASSKIDLDAERETIYAQVKAEFEKEIEVKAKLEKEVEKAGLKVEGNNSTQIMANAIEQAGGKAANENGEAFSGEVLAQIWASIAAFRTVDDINQQEINALSADKGGVVKALAGSRADRINQK